MEWNCKKKNLNEIRMNTNMVRINIWQWQCCEKSEKEGEKKIQNWSVYYHHTDNKDGTKKHWLIVKQ